jgi:hypothetical protein
VWLSLPFFASLFFWCQEAFVQRKGTFFFQPNKVDSTNVALFLRGGSNVSWEKALDCSHIFGSFTLLMRIFMSELLSLFWETTSKQTNSKHLSHFKNETFFSRKSVFVTRLNSDKLYYSCSGSVERQNNFFSQEWGSSSLNIILRSRWKKYSPIFQTM